ncbi:MAG: class I SAM-dependent methyltransferase [Alphaproteobacteria bacterium]|nr:class I SAM-dependent methyltransferase [Alphaproteobacteria bacterium]MBO6628045.1 class I SAM-dependent methyltransferase [Alphaproteobacteria bacterium]
MFGVLLNRVVQKGSVTLVRASGRTNTYGDGSGSPVTIRLHQDRLSWKLALNPYLRLGEAYMDGSLTIDPPARIYDFLDILLANIGIEWAHPLAKVVGRVRRAKRRIDQFNPTGRAKANVAHHYDLDGGLYDLFLDDDRQYSCAYFDHPGMSLSDAQHAKKRHIAAKLQIAPGMKVLDIGCGWGGMALYLARTTGAHVTGVTLSEEQHKTATERVAAAGLSHQIDIRLQDYRQLDAEFDRIVSVGMFEHVGVGHYDEFAAQLKALLSPDGVALLHTIGRLDSPGATNPWIAKYIFPGGYIPALSEVAPVLERHGLLLNDLEVLRLHYAETLRHWRERFLTRWDEAVSLYDERFARMWEFYLAGSETSFRHEGMVVFQFQLTRQIDRLPLTRDYISAWKKTRSAERTHFADAVPSDTRAALLTYPQSHV